MNTFFKSKKLFRVVIRIAKANSTFTYFILESNENLCFYSTMDASLHEPYRDIVITTAVEFKENIENLLSKLSREFQIITLESDIIEDSAALQV